MATSFNLDPAPELVPELEGNKVVFTRKEDVEAAAEVDKADSAQAVDAEDSKASAQRSKAASK